MSTEVEELRVMVAACEDIAAFLARNNNIDTFGALEFPFKWILVFYKDKDTNGITGVRAHYSRFEILSPNLW